MTVERQVATGRRRLRYGIYLPPMGPLGDPADLVELAVRAEAAGWDGVFLWDHVVSTFTPVADTWTTLGAIAAATHTVRLGPMVTPLPRRRPWIVARQAATVSRLSGGRLILGAGLGTDETGDLSRFGDRSSLAERRSRFDEGVEVVRGMWSGAAYRHDGAHYQVTLETSAPEPHPLRIWSAGSSTGRGVVARAAACEGMFFNPGHEPTPDEVAAVLDGLRAAGVADGRPYDVAVCGNASDAWPEPMRVDLDGLADAGATWWLESLMYLDPLELSLEVAGAPPPGRSRES